MLTAPVESPMQTFGRNQIAFPKPECRISNKVYPPSAAPEATREFRMMKLNLLFLPSAFVIRYSIFCGSFLNFYALCEEVLF
jgi:hypothetical protein